MTKRVEGSEPIPHWATDLFSPENIDRIIERVGIPADKAKRTYLLRELNEAVSQYHYFRAFPTPATIRNRLATIEQTAHRLLKALEAEGNSGPEDALLIRLEGAADDEPKEEWSTYGVSGCLRLVNAVRGIGSLQRWAAHALAEVTIEVKPRGKTPDTARQWFMAHLARIYRETFGRKPGVSRPPGGGPPGGPFVRFVDACLREMGEHNSLETVATWARRGKNFDWGIVGIKDDIGRVLYSREPSE